MQDLNPTLVVITMAKSKNLRIRSLGPVLFNEIFFTKKISLEAFLY